MQTLLDAVEHACAHVCNTWFAARHSKIVSGEWQYKEQWHGAVQGSMGAYIE